MKLGALDPAASDDALAATLLAPFGAEIDRARRVLVIAMGDARSIDVHALPWGGAPLVAKVPVVYPIDRRGPGSNDGFRAALVQAIRRRTSAGRAPTAVRAALAATAWDVTALRGPDATGAAVRAALPASDLFEYSGHGVFGGRDGLGAELPLADHGALTVADVLALPRAPRRVVLLGRETARESSDARVGGGVAQAFVIAGAQVVVAATRDVNDAATTALARDLYAKGASGDLVEALRAAQVAASARGERDWRAFRALVP